MNNGNLQNNKFESLGSTAEMRSLLEHSDRSIIILDSVFRILWFNAKAAQSMQAFYNEKLQTGNSYWDHVDEDRHKRFIRNFNATLKGRKITTEQRVIQPTVTQAEKWVEGRFSPLKDKDQNIKGVIYSFINISDRKRAEHKDMERTNVMQAINHNETQAFILIGADNQILSCNMLAPILLATLPNKKEPYAMNVVDCIHPNWKERFVGGLQVARTGGTVAMEFEIPSEQERVIEVRFTPVKDRLGKKNMVSVWAIEITDRKQAELEVKRSEENLKAVFDNSLHSFYLLDRKLRILAFNRAAEKLMLKLQGVQLSKGMKLTDATAKEDLIRLRVEAERAFSGRTVVVEKHFRINEKDLWFEWYVNPVRNNNGKIDRITLWSINVTERKMAEKALKDSESRFRKLAVLLPVGIYQVDMNRNFTYINEGLQLIIGDAMARFTDGSWVNQLHTDDTDRTKKVWRLARKNEDGFSVEYRFVRRSGETIHVMERAQPLFDHLGNHSGYLGVIIDITEQKQNQKLIQDNKVVENSLRFRSDFLASMSHEIRTPINGIMGLSEMLLDTNLSADQHSKIKNILGASMDLRSIVNEVLNLSQLEAGKVILEKELFKSSQLLEAVAERYQPEAGEKGLQLIFEKPENTTALFTDRRRVTQVLSNLVRNAIKFTTTGSVTVSTQVKNKRIRFEVTDTGPGIPVKDQEKLFQDFVQLEHTTAQGLEGTGLGLSISRKLVQLLGGTIGVQSTFEQGSTFWFEVAAPDIKQSLKSVETTPLQSDSQKNLSGTRVLLVEDNLINQQAFKLMLRKMGCTVDVRSNGKQAVDNFGQNRYDIVFMDIQMPEMDGLQATTEIKKRFKDVPPIVGLSGNILQRDANGNLTSDMDDLLLKPVVSNDIERMIRKWMA